VGRISFWKAEALMARIGERPTGPESPLELLARVRVHHKVKDIIRTSGIGRSAYYDWTHDPNSVKPDTAADILTALRKLDANKPSE
jgi:hypothetical protein